MSQFEWNTDEDNWDDPLPEPGGRRPSPPGRLRWLAPLLVLALLAATGFGVWRTVSRQVAAGTELVETEVRAAFQLINLAAQNADIEIFSAALSGADRGWTVIQQQLVAQRDLFDRTAFGLELLAQPPEIVALRLAPGLDSAEITARYSYAVAGGSSETVTLDHTLVFRKGDDRWLYAPPVDAFWGDGEPTTLAGTPVDAWIEAPRDGDLAARLVQDLNAIFYQICAQRPMLDCAPSRREQMTARFHAEPEHLLALERNLALSRMTVRDLPTPTLVGVPSDDAGYQAVLRGYARLILPPLLASAANYECCDQLFMAQALIDWAMAQLGLAPWLLDQASADSPPDPLTLLSTLNGAWSGSSRVADVRYAVAVTDAARRLVDFLFHEMPGLDPFVALAALSADDARLGDWLLRVSTDHDTTIGLAVAGDSGGYVASMLVPAWDAYQRRLAAAPPADAPADEQVALSCQQPLGRQLRTLVFGYRPNADRWHELGRDIGPLRGVTGLFPQPDGGGVWLREESAMGKVSNLHFINSDRPSLSVRYADGQSDHFAVWGRTDPSGDLVIVNQFFAERFGWFDTTACDSGLCPFTRLDGEPFWSPDGTQTLLWDFFGRDDGALYLADAAGADARQIANAAGRPVWLTDDVFGYVTRGQSLAQMRFVRQNRAGTQVLSRPLAPVADALPIDADYRLESIEPLAHPARPDRVYFVLRYNLTDVFNIMGYTAIIVYDGQSDQFSAVYETEGQLSAFDFSADGRLFSFAENDSLTRTFAAVVYDGDSGDLIVHPAGSAFEAALNDDGTWLALLTADALTLRAVASSTVVQVPLRGVACHHLAWITS